MSLKHLLLKNKKQLLLYSLGVLLTMPTNLLMTFGVGKAFDILTVTKTSEALSVAFISFSLGLSPVLLQYLSRHLRIGFMRDILAQVRILAYDKLLARDIEAFRSKPKEDYQSQLTSDINLFENDFFLSILNIAHSFGSFLLGFAVLFWIAPLIALLLLGASFLLFILTKVYEAPTIKRRRDVVAENKKYHRGLSNVLRGLETIKLSRVEQKFKTLFSIEVDELEDTKESLMFVNEQQSAVMQSLAMLFQMIAFIYAAYLFSKNQIELGQMVVVINLMGQLMWTMNSGFSLMNRFKTSLDVYDKLTNLDNARNKKESLNSASSIQASTLSFAYGDKCIFQDLSIDINANDKVLIHGPSGTGKTTLLDCLSKNLSDYEGLVMVGDYDLKEVKDESFWNFVGYARQEHFIFNDSIRNNIILNKPYDENKLASLYEGLALTPWIESLQDKDQTELYDNGKNISGGQRQRISLARELYQDKNILFFDEPSASLDDETAHRVYQTIMRLDKTIIFVTHRHLNYLSENFDRIVDLEVEGHQ